MGVFLFVLFSTQSATHLRVVDKNEKEKKKEAKEKLHAVWGERAAERNLEKSECFLGRRLRCKMK